jgi:hypothetical protein
MGMVILGLQGDHEHAEGDEHRKGQALRRCSRL